MYYLWTILLLLLNSCQNRSKNQKIDTSDNTYVILEPSIVYLDSSLVNKFISQYVNDLEYTKHISLFYQKRNYECAWIEQDGINEYARNFLNLINHEVQDNNRDTLLYQSKLNTLFQILSEKHNKFSNSDSLVVQAELLLTITFLDFTKQNWGGLSQKKAESVHWFMDRKSLNYEELLKTFFNKDEQIISTYKPVYKQYTLLQERLKQYTEIEKKGGWIDWTNDIQQLKKGDTLTVIPLVKKQLFLLGDLIQEDSSIVFNDLLEKAVKKFQKRHGLMEDGVIAHKTLSALGISLSERIQQLIINIERCKWVPEEPSGDYLLVNIPNFKLLAYRNNKIAWTCNVVVGQTKEASNTVIFNGMIESVVFSPYWNIPKSIVLKETLPEIKKNINYLSQHNMEVVDFDGKKINESSIRWRKYTDHFPYIIRQKPGKDNALGLVKFLFPNPYTIYLHDTPSKSLFDESSRAFSHGCIRVDKSFELAAFLLNEDSVYTEKKIIELMNLGKEKHVRLKRKIPIFITYFTAWVTREGALNFREDIYAHDKKMKQLLFSNSLED